MEKSVIFEMADRLKSLKKQKKDLEDSVKAIGSEIEELDRQLSDAMAETQLDSFSRNGSTFYLYSRLYASPSAGRKDAMVLALKQNGYGSLVVESVNSKTLSSFVREQKEANQGSIPSWLSDTVSTYEKISVGIRKS